MYKKGFPPLLPEHPRILILGSMPGEASLSATQYYAHKHNLFWPFMALICSEPLPDTYEKKKAMLLRHDIAVWDVCDTCIREGSLDTAIKEAVPNPIKELLEQYPGIQAIAFNGQKAATLFRKHFGGTITVPEIVLPSTSPANAGIPRAQKEAAWLQLKKYLNRTKQTSVKS